MAIDPTVSPAKSLLGFNRGVVPVRAGKTRSSLVVGAMCCPVGPTDQLLPSDQLLLVVLKPVQVAVASNSRASSSSTQGRCDLFGFCWERERSLVLKLNKRRNPVNGIVQLLQ